MLATYGCSLLLMLMASLSWSYKTLTHRKELSTCCMIILTCALKQMYFNVYFLRWLRNYGTFNWTWRNLHPRPRIWSVVYFGKQTLTRSKERNDLECYKYNVHIKHYIVVDLCSLFLAATLVKARVRWMSRAAAAVARTKLHKNILIKCLRENTFEMFGWEKLRQKGERTFLIIVYYLPHICKRQSLFLAVTLLHYILDHRHESAIVTIPSMLAAQSISESSHCTVTSWWLK